MLKKSVVAAAAATAVLGLSACSEGGLLESSVEIACENLVKDRLKSPATAEFGSILDDEDTKAKDNGDGTWQVRGQVDSQNGFGATVRSVFQCTITVEDGEPVRGTVDEIAQL